VSTDRGGRSLLASPVRRALVDELAGLPWVPTPAERRTRRSGLTASDLALRLGLHVTTIRYHADQLLAAGVLVAHDERVGVGRPRRCYALNPLGSPLVDNPEAYRLLTLMLAEAPPRLPPVEVGSRWIRAHRAQLLPDTNPTPADSPGAWLARIAVVVDLLGRWGYGARVRTTDEGHTAELAFTDCPLRELALTDRALVCGVHQGVLCGVMTSLGEDAEVSLVPFVEPNLCLARVTTRAVFSHLGGLHDRHPAPTGA